VIGGLYRLEGAWLGALVFVVINNYIRSVPGLGHIGLSEERFHTVIGVIFLVIILLSPGGLMGILGKGHELAGRLFPGGRWRLPQRLLRHPGPSQSPPSRLFAH